MPNEAGTDTTRSDAPSVDDDLFGDAEAADDKTAVPADEHDSDAGNAPEQQEAGDEVEQAPQGSDDAAETEAPQEEQDSGDAGAPADGDASSEDDLKVVLSIKGGRAVIGVQKPSADPHIETFEESDLPGLAQEVVAVVERARARWEETPKHPAYERPAPPARRRNRRQQGAAQGATADGAETEQAQQQTLALF